MSEQCVIFTDLDGTLLDHHDYSWEAAREAMSVAKKNNIPVIINTSKTRSEVNTILNELPLSCQPFVVENGSAIVFPNISNELLSKLKRQSQYQLIENQHTWVFGEKRNILCDWLNNIRELYHFKLESYQDWTTETVMSKTGLSESKALESKNKEFSEPFQWFDTIEKLSEFTQLAELQGYSILRGGRFYHLQGAVTKACVFDFVRQYQGALFPKSSSLKIIALGDNHNDIDMLNRSDLAVCIKSPVNAFPNVSNPAVIYSHQFGPKGWNEELLKLLQILEIYYPIDSTS